jgi:hypothetical protein
VTMSTGDMQPSRSDVGEYARAQIVEWILRLCGYSVCAFKRLVADRPTR